MPEGRGGRGANARGVRLALSAAVLVAVSVWSSAALPGAAAADLYCGVQNCYDLLRVDPAASTAEIKKAFHKVSLALHPDKNKAPGAEAAYRDVVNAYEVLSDNVSRANYDDALANPDRFFTNTYQYYQYRAGLHQTALWKVLTGLLAFATLVHYLAWAHGYSRWHRIVKEQPAVQKRLRETVIARHPELGKPLLSKEDGVRLEKLMSEEDVRAHVAITGWEQMPGLSDLLVVQLVWRYPRAIASYVYWWARWCWRYDLHRMPYAPEDQPYVTARALNIHWDRWVLIPEPERNRLVAKQLWRSANMKEYRREIISSRKKKW